MMLICSPVWYDFQQLNSTEIPLTLLSTNKEFKLVLILIYEPGTYSDLFNYFPDLGLKAHVQHAVCLVQHQVSASSQVGLSSLQEVYQSAGCRYHYLHPSFYVTSLRPLRRSSVQTCVADICWRSKVCSNLSQHVHKLVYRRQRLYELVVAAANHTDPFK